MIANQNSEDDTRGGGAHGPPLSFRESIWGTVAPRVPKHPPLREPPPKSICPTPEPILPGTLKLSRRSAGFKSLPQDRIRNSRQKKQYTTRKQIHPPERNLQTPCPNHSMAQSRCPGAATGRRTGTGPHCLKSRVICDSRFESRIAIAVKSRDLEFSECRPCRLCMCFSLHVAILLANFRPLSEHKPGEAGKPCARARGHPAPQGLRCRQPPPNQGRKLGKRIAKQTGTKQSESLSEKSSCP